MLKVLVCRGLFRVAVAVLSLSIVAGCGGGDESSSTGTTTTSTTTSTSTTTTSSTTTTTEPPSDEDQIRDVLTAWSTLYPDLGDPPSSEAPELEILVDPVRTRVIQDLPQLRAAGQHLEGSVEIDVDEIVVDGDTATVYACAQGRVLLIDAEGRDVSASVGATIDPPSHYEYQLSRVDGQWRLSNFSFRKDQLCELS